MLREYQHRTITQLYDWFERNPTGNPCLVLPTGSGKSHHHRTPVRKMTNILRTAVNAGFKTEDVERLTEQLLRFAELPRGILRSAPTAQHRVGMDLGEG